MPRILRPLAQVPAMPTGAATRDRGRSRGKQGRRNPKKTPERSKQNPIGNPRIKDLHTNGDRKKIRKIPKN